MSTETKQNPPHRLARDLYERTFGAEQPEEVVEAMEAWGELDDGEQRYVLGHLLYLQVLGQARVAAALMRVRDAVDGVEEAVRNQREGTAVTEEAVVPPAPVTP